MTAEQLWDRLHSSPELSGRESATKDIIQDFIEKETDLVLCRRDSWLYGLHREEGAAQTIALRADMDALPDGRCGAWHGCGHDGHMAMLLDAARLLRGRRVGRNVIFLFQPAEETGQGARQCLSLFDEQHVDRIYGCHNIPGYAEGTVLLAKDTFADASEGLILDFQGRECHAACPEEGISPAPLIAQLILQLPEITAKVGEKGFAQTTLISVHVGEENFGISAGQGRLCLTIRAEKDQILQELESLIVSRAKAGARSAGLMMSLERRDIFPATVCDRQLSRQLEQVMTRAGIPCRYLPAPMRWSEDFGHYGSRTRAVFFGIGSGEDQPGLHTPDYVFPRELVKTGGRIWMQIIEHAL